MTGMPLCELTDLPRILCAHCDSFTMTPEEIAYVRGEVPQVPVHHQIPMVARSTDYAPRTAGGWAVDIPKVLLCDHGHSDDTFLCPDCIGMFEQTLGDIPALITELDLALTKQVTFLETGAPVEADPEESTLPFNVAASKALGALWRAFSGDPVHMSRKMLLGLQHVTNRPDIPEVAGRITAAVAVAHRVIDRPPTLAFYGPCPLCAADIYQERTTIKSEIIRCQTCDYSATLQEHQRNCLDAGSDRWLTVTELVSTLTRAGEPITRSQIDNMIYRNGLPREERMLPKWRDGRLVQEMVHVCRLGDVRDMMIRDAARRDSA